MTRTPWILLLVNTFFALVLGFANYATKVDPTKPLSWLDAQALMIQPSAWRLIFYLTTLTALLQWVAFFYGRYQFRRDVVRRFLDECVREQLAGNSKENRLSLFKAVKGWRVWLSVLFRRIWSQEDKVAVVKELIRKSPFGTYLFVYVRASGSLNDLSCVAYRVRSNRLRECEGVAGLVWGKDSVTLSELPSFAEGALKDIKDLSEYKPNDPVSIYARKTNIRRASQLRMMERYARHFLGIIIASDSGKRKWGVLLVDSTQEQCPFAVQGQRSKTFRKQFEHYADSLSKILS